MTGVFRVFVPILAAVFMTVGCAPSAMGPISYQSPQPGMWTPPPSIPNVIQSPPIVSNPWKPDGPPREWRHIVIHHTASSGGSVESIHEAHLGRGWDGIGYHFVIGNGEGMDDGVIEPTFRWREQMHGAHAGKDEYNQHGIGICLIGNFQESHPSAAQLAAVKRLVSVLKNEYGVPGEKVIPHRDVKATACPGKNFPLAEVSRSVLLPTLVEVPVLPAQQVASTEWSQRR